MKVIKRRLAVHFTLQFILLWIFVLITLIICLLFLLQYLVNQDLKRTFPIGAVETIISETDIQNNEVHLPKRWIDLLTDRGYWLQVVNEQGSVIYALNTPSDIPTTYSATHLLQIDESRKIDHYPTSIVMDEIRDRSFLFLLGSEDVGAEELESLFLTFTQEGTLTPMNRVQLEHHLNKNQEYIYIIDPIGKVIDSFGEAAPRKTSIEPLELASNREFPSQHGRNLSSFYDELSSHTWLLYSNEQSNSSSDHPVLKDMITVLALMGGLLLLFTVIVSLWQGYRYGMPLTLFMEWFQRMGKGRYHEALTQRDRKQVFRKNGKIRLRYRLYKEVIAGFYQMAARLENSEQERHLLEKTREEWMTGISHDLRTPLSTIQGYGHLLESGQFQWSEEELKDMGKMIRVKGDFMVDLLQDFSLTFQLKNNALNFPLHAIELNEFVRRVVLRYVNDATIHHVTFNYEGQDDPLWIRANDKWFQRMLDNIISNAIKHNEDGTTITITTTLSTHNEAMIRIADNGRGMDEDTCRNLFERYYRGTNTNEETVGAGLGMSIAKAIAQAHRGRIKVDSTLGIGTVISLNFALTEYNGNGH